MMNKCLEHLCPVIMVRDFPFFETDEQIFHKITNDDSIQEHVTVAIVYDRWEVVMRLIRLGYRRPEHEDLQFLCQYGDVPSLCRYFKQIGVPVTKATCRSVVFFPELLGLLHDPDKYIYQSNNGDITRGSSIHITEELLAIAMDLRPDLHDIIRKLVIENSFIGLFARFQVLLEEVDISKAFAKADTKTIHEWMKIWDVTEDFFYPAIARSSYTFADFMGPAFIQYVIDNWNSLEPKHKKKFKNELPKKCVASLLHESVLSKYSEHGGISDMEKVQICKDYSSFFPEFNTVHNAESFHTVLGCIMRRYEA